MKRLLFLALAITLPPLPSRAQIAGAEIVGWMSLTCLGNSDTIVSPPLARPAAYIGSATGADVSAGLTGKLTFSGASFAAGQFKYVAGTQPNTYYAFIASGSKEGDFFVVTDNDATSLTLALNGDSVAAIAAGTTVKIVPFWTLGTLLPSGTAAAAVEVLLPNTSASGINLPAATSYSFSASAGHWVSADGGASMDDVTLSPDAYFTVRNDAAATTTLTLAGAARTTKTIVALNTASTGKQDNAVALNTALPIALKDAGLISSGAFAASSGFAAGDQLFVFDNATAALNKSASRIYTYSGGAWRRAGSAADADSDVIFTPGAGVIIRKARTNNGATVFWTAPANVSK